MTTEEKAKAYDIALEKAQEIKGKILQSHLSTESCKAVSEYINTIIPELAESDDERIRKELIDYILYKVGPHITEEQEHRWVSWLEKQKESLHIPESCKENADSFTDEDERIIKEIRDLLVNACEADRRYPHLLAWLEKQKEQKSTESKLEDAFKYYTDNGITISCGDLIAKPKEQNPVEWNEKDETIIEGACNALEIHGHTKLASMLKSLHPQPKQEWSEHDEHWLKLCIGELQSFWKFKKDKLFCKKKEKEDWHDGLIAWLQDLRPQKKED